MIFIVLTIISSTALFVIFKLAANWGTDKYPVILINYFTAFLLGFLIMSLGNKGFQLQQNWLPFAFAIGVLFIVMFYLIAISTRVAGIAVTGIASKMSVIFPILFSLFIDTTDKLSYIKLLGIVTALIAILLTAYKKEGGEVKKEKILLPLILFVGMGLTDSVVKWAQYLVVSNDKVLPFSTTIFIFSAITGIIFGFVHEEKFHNLLKYKSILLGFLLGIFNFGSIYFIIRALNHQDTITLEKVDGSIVFGTTNLGIVSLSVIVGLIFFGEKITTINWVGISLSILSVLLLAFSS